MTLEAIKYECGSLQILDQLKLPAVTDYLEIKTVEDGWNAIKNMQVRGAPAIALVGSLSIVAEIYPQYFDNAEQLVKLIGEKLDYLITARPTAVNMKTMANHLSIYLSKTFKNINDASDIKNAFISEVVRLLKTDLADNKNIGCFGSQHMISNPLCSKTVNGGLNVLTHCNTGSLATSGYGTALGVIRSLHKNNQLAHAYCTETRPYNQGARLTAYELVYEKIPSTLIADSMVALLMKTKQISAVVVGADRIAKNGDTANKIGTYQIAIAAKYHNVPFYIAAPFSSIDKNSQCGNEIVIEERPSHELTTINGIKIAAEGIHSWNPAFDVTPNDLITGGIITERGVFSPENLKNEL